MCFGNRQSAPAPAPPPPLAPASPPPAPPPAVPPPPQVLNGASGIQMGNGQYSNSEPTLKTKRSKREETGALSKGVSSLKIPMKVSVNTGGSGGMNL